MGREKGFFQKGNTGRPKGSTNRSLTRGRIISILAKEDNWKKFETELFKMKGRAFVENFIKLWEFDTPKYSAISFSLSNMSEQDLELLIEKLKEQMSNEES